MHHFSLSKSIQVLLFLFLGIAGLYYAKPFLVPVVFAGLFSMLLLPVSVWLQNKGLAKGLAVLLSVLLFVAIVTGIVWLVVWQIFDIGKRCQRNRAKPYKKA